MKKKNAHKNKRHGGAVRAKKHLGQHFLVDRSIAAKIADSLDTVAVDNLLEIGPGTGVLTQFLVQKPVSIIAMDVDEESINYLNSSPEFDIQTADIEIWQADFLEENINAIFRAEEFAIIGNFPYNISSQILFRTIENRDRVPAFCGMFQKEVAKRICSGPGSKSYGILSVLTQAFYHTEYLFTVPPAVFNPPPKVDSGVLRLQRKENYRLGCDEKLFFKVVKTGFQQRRKTLRNSLKRLNLSDELRKDPVFKRRPEALSVSEFVDLTQKIAEDGD